MNRLMRVAAILFTVTGIASGQQLPLDSLLICIDPGHGGHNDNDRHVVPDPGTDFWESESNFQKALLLKTLLEAQGASVILTRTTNDTTGYVNNDGDPDEPGLQARVAIANANNVDWFHSIHSNAVGDGLQTTTAINYTLILVREKRPGGPASGSGNGLGVAEQPQSLTMAGLMAPAIKSILRTNSYMTYLDWTFYGGVNGGFSLGVLRGLLMPGELSEGSMHDYAPETRRLMNNDYRKMEAYALRNAIMQYYGVPPETMGIIAGIQSDIASGALVNETSVRLLPENRLYAGDHYNNGFYAFDAVPPGMHTVRFETPGYTVDSVQVNIAAGSTNFLDRSLVSFAFPTITRSSPLDNDTAFAPNLPIVLNFSKPMDTASVRNALSFEPAIPGTMAWTSSNSVLTYTPSGILPFYVHYTLRLDTTAHSLSGQTVDGDGNGTPGDSFVLHFTTRFIDAIPPSIVARSPDSSAVMLFPSSVVNLTFSEPLNAASVNTTNIAVGRVGGSALPRTFQYWERGGKGGVNVYPTNGLLPGAGYLMRVSGVQDKAGNPIPTSSPLIWQFSVASYTAAGSAIDPFDSSVIRWLQPKASASTVGVDTAAFAFVPSMTIPVLGGDGGSAAIRFTWDTTASEWLLREELPSGGGQAVHWRKENAILQAYLFGDAGMSEFRFAIHDSGGYAVSRWMPVNWVGWKLVQWDLEHDSVGSWLGSGKPEGDLTFDSFQFRYVSGVSARSGELFVDQLEIVNRTISGIPSQSPDAPLSFALEQNYPNPFNPATVIRYAIVGARGQGQGTSYVRLVVYDLLGREVVMLVNENKAPGNYEVTFDAAGLASGVYFYRLSSGNFVQTRKMLLLQ